jgi:ABC-type nitrate/sulfonate/bicarbonate transport system permease component
VYLNTSEIFAWLIIIILISITFDFIMNCIKNIVIKEHTKRNGV